MIIGGLICFLFGIMLTITIIGAIIGIPLILIGVILFIVGLFKAKEVQRVEVVHVHKYKK